MEIAVLFRSAPGVSLAGASLALVAAGLVMHFELIGEASRAIVDAAPPLLAAATLLLAWRYRRRQLAIASVLVAVLAEAGPWASAIGSDPAGDAVGLWAWLIAALLTVPALAREGALFRWPTLLQLALMTIGGAAHLAFAKRLVERADAEHVLVSLSPAVPFALGAALALAAAFLTRRALAAALSVTMVGLALASEGWLGPLDRPLLLAACQLGLLFALLEESYRLAYHDALTGLPGRRALHEALDGLGGRYALAMVDIDHFKRFNDRHGHEAGDQVLRMVARELARSGASGRAHRYGGEEFAIVFPSCGEDEARKALEDVRRSIARRAFVLRDPSRPRRKPASGRPRRVGTKRVKVTVSGGVAEAAGRGVTAKQTLQAADKALYRAKRAGRNRIEVAPRRRVSR